MSISIHRLCHPLGVRVAVGTVISLEVGIEGLVHLPVEPFLNTVIFSSWAARLGRVPLGAAILGRAVEVVLGRELHPHGIVTTEATVGGCQVRIVELIRRVRLVVKLLRCSLRGYYGTVLVLWIPLATALLGRVKEVIQLVMSLCVREKRV